jgi:hypothetical protein
MDYRPLNPVTIEDRYPFHQVDLLFDQLARAKVFLNIDLRSRYHHIKIKAEDISRMALTTRYRFYEYLVTSFGLTNARISDELIVHARV